ncbi:hypothetical protein H5410_060628 [Solanum commersonii]|uniref:Retrotransposon gag domain-containing protein n=1 Tax=Solanum commersonii TaxID=4109 RepID=A0A9J5W748_SOLCO|nr:hypothetical protein H5410_060628 [Solanum commersonii]
MEDQIFRIIDGSIKVVKDSWSKDIAEIRCMLQEVLGKLSPTTPQFALDSYSSFVKIPRFNVDDPATWVFQVKQYFTHYNIFSDKKLSLASFYLDDDALNWYCWLFRNKQLANWDHFVAKLQFSLSPSTYHNKLLSERNCNYLFMEYHNQHSLALKLECRLSL